MRETIKLSKPIMVNGKLRDSFEHDASEITAPMFIEADARSSAAVSRTGSMSLSIVETNASMQTYLGMMAIVAVNPDVDISDLERIKGNDIMQIYRIGRNFMKGNAEDAEDAMALDYEENTSEEQCEPTAEPTIAK